MRRQFLTYYDFKKTAKKLQFCQIFRFSKKRARKVNFVYDFKLMYKINEDSYAFNFFSSESCKSILFNKNAHFTFQYEVCALLEKHEHLVFKKMQFRQKSKKCAKKMRIFYFSALATSEMEKAHFFLPRTGRVCRKCAFWLLKTEISKMKRGILKWVAELPVYIKSAAFGRIWCAKSIEWKWLGKSRDITIHNRITIHIGFTYKFVSALCMKKKKKLLVGRTDNPEVVHQDLVLKIRSDPNFRRRLTELALEKFRILGPGVLLFEYPIPTKTSFRHFIERDNVDTLLSHFRWYLPCKLE